MKYLILTFLLLFSCMGPESKSSVIKSSGIITGTSSLVNWAGKEDNTYVKSFDSTGIYSVSGLLGKEGDTVIFYKHYIDDCYYYSSSHK